MNAITYSISMKWSIGRNRVLIRPDKDDTRVLGMEGTDFTPQHFYSTKGVVVGVGPFFYKKGSRASRDFSATGVRVGDRVIFNYMAHVSGTRLNDCLIMPIDWVYAKLDPLTAINGWVLFEVEEEAIEDHGGLIYEREDVNKYGQGRVVSASGPGEWLHGGLWVAPMERIWYSKRSAARLEMDHKNTLTDKQSSLFKIKASDILWTSRG